ncbi:MAG: hypothetical protein GEV11_11220 [Streptosporangiales bacterium]|nr:hypothetical protein [Streptosporangiales bacterium]
MTTPGWAGSASQPTGVVPSVLSAGITSAANSSMLVTTRSCGMYLVAEDSLSDGLRAYRQVLYEPGSEVRPRAGTEVLARLGDPYFTRTHDRFTSHAQTPYERTSERPAITRHGRVIYCANPLFAGLPAARGALLPRARGRAAGPPSARPPGVRA